MSAFTNNQVAKITKNLIEDESPVEWISWLFDIQNQLIATGHCESLSRKGSEDFSGKFAALKNFFEDLQLAETVN